MLIEDGSGNSYKAAVNSKNKLQTHAVSTSELHEISHAEGDVHVFNTAGFLTVTTTATEHGMFYLENTSSKDMFIHSIRTCGDQIQKIKLYKEVTAGTLLTDATVGGSGNINQTSSKIASANIYIGGNGKTITGTEMSQHINAIGHLNESFDGAMILGKGDNIAISCEMASAGSFCVRVIAYYGSF